MCDAGLMVCSTDCGLRPLTQRQADNLNEFSRVNGNASGITYHRPEGPLELAGPVLPVTKPAKRSERDSGHRASKSVSMAVRSAVGEQRQPAAGAHRRAQSYAAAGSEWGGSGDDLDDDVLHATELGGFPRLEDLPPGVDRAPFRSLWTLITRHLDQLLKDVRAGNFDDFELHNTTFWPTLTFQQRALCRHTAFSNLVGQADAAVYDVRREARGGCLG